MTEMTRLEVNYTYIQTENKFYELCYIICKLNA